MIDTMTMIKEDPAILALHDDLMTTAILNRTSSMSSTFTVASFSKKKRNHNKLMKPGPFDVICARGKQAFNHPGNQYFRSLIAKATAKYSKVESKLQRSMIVTEIVDAVREKGNGFIRQTTQGEWIECSDVMCREKVGQHFRNALGTMYKSSTKSKRRVKEEFPKLAENLSDFVLSNDAVQTTMERLSMDVIFLEEEDESEFLEKTLIANMKLLKIFKEDNTSIVKKFQQKYEVGQQALDAAYRFNRNRKPPKRNCGNARAA